MATLEKVFDELRELKGKVQTIEDAIVGSDYIGVGLREKTDKNTKDIEHIKEKFKHFYFFLIGAGLAGGYTVLDLVKKIFL